MLCYGECGPLSGALTRADWISKTVGVDWGYSKWSSGTARSMQCADAFGSRPCQNSRGIPCRQLQGNDDGAAKSDSGRQLLPAGALRGTITSCILAQEIIPDVVACQYVVLGLNVPVVVA